MSSSSAGSRTAALTTPLRAITANASPATNENRRAARSVCVPRRHPWASRANNPPAHTDAATRCSTRLLVAMSCDPPDDECPVRASGIRVTSDSSSRYGTHDQRTAARISTARIRASADVHAHASAVSTCPIAPHRFSGFSASASGCPEVSDRVSGTSTAEHNAQIRAAAPAVRTAR